MKPETKRPVGAEIQDQSRRVWLLSYAPLVLWIVVVLGLSTGQGAMSETSRIIRPLLEFLFPAAAPETLSFYHGIIRKCAHFTEYAILGWLACRAFLASATFLRKSPFLFGLGLVILVAIIDETNQSFNPERTGSVWDVLLDIAGGAFAIVAVAAVRHRLCKRVAGL